MSCANSRSSSFSTLTELGLFIMLATPLTSEKLFFGASWTVSSKLSISMTDGDAVTSSSASSENVRTLRLGVASMIFLNVEFFKADFRSVFSCRSTINFFVGVIFVDTGVSTADFVGAGVVKSIKYIDFFALLSGVSQSIAFEVDSVRIFLSEVFERREADVAVATGVFLSREELLVAGEYDVFKVPDILRESSTSGLGVSLTFSLLREMFAIGVLKGLGAFSVVSASSLTGVLTFSASLNFFIEFTLKIISKKKFLSMPGAGDGMFKLTCELWRVSWFSCIEMSLLCVQIWSIKRFALWKKQIK